MKVRIFKSMIEHLDDDAEIFIVDPDSGYASGISLEVNKGLAAFWGNDKKNCVFLLKDGQVGAMCNRSDLDLDE